MRYLLSSFVVLTVGLLAMPALADPTDKEAKQGDGGPRAEMREKMLKEFDKDGDGKLNDEERAKAHEKMRELHGERGRGEGRRGAEAHRGPGGGPDGPPKLPKPEELFTKFDKDKDEKLSKDEFMALADFVHEHMPPPPPGPPGGPRFGGRGPDGPPGGHFEGHFEGRIEGRFIEGGPDGPRFREGDGPGRRPFGLGPGGPPRDGEEGRALRRRPDGPPPEGGPGRPSKDDKEKGDKEKAESAT